MEIHRYTSILSLSLQHRTMSNTHLFGFTIPKGTIVIPNLWACHHDPHYWNDPDVFRPERFLDELGEVHKPEYLIPFSVGKLMDIMSFLISLECRFLILFFSYLLLLISNVSGGRICLGKSLAEMNVFLFFTCLLQQFSFSLIPGVKPPSFESIYALVLEPEPFSLRVQQR